MKHSCHVKYYLSSFFLEFDSNIVLFVRAALSSALQGNRLTQRDLALDTSRPSCSHARRSGVCPLRAVWRRRPDLSAFENQMGYGAAIQATRAKPWQLTPISVPVMVRAVTWKVGSHENCGQSIDLT
eukprot:sb/3475428/